MDITELLFYTKKNNASDLHLSAGCVPAVRVHGDILRLKMPALQPDEVKHMVYSIMTDAQRAEYEREMEIDFAIQFGNETRFRVNAFNTLQGAAASFRVIPAQVHNIDDLRLPDVVRHLASLERGLVLVTGPTGSGKSTTLAAMIDYVNRNMAKHVITIEDPIEFVYQEGKSLINQRELESSTKSFARALKSALRQDPDIILVGEMRDLETIELALTAAETGHLVFGTLHTNSAAKTIDRIVDVFPSHDKELIRSMLSTSLEGVLSQKLWRI